MQIYTRENLSNDMRLTEPKDKIRHISHDKIVIMSRDVTINDENVKNIRIVLIFLTYHQFLNRMSILDCCVNNIDSISLHGRKYCQILHSWSIILIDRLQSTLKILYFQTYPFVLRLTLAPYNGTVHSAAAPRIFCNGSVHAAAVPCFKTRIYDV